MGKERRGERGRRASEVAGPGRVLGSMRCARVWRERIPHWLTLRVEGEQ